MLVASCSSTLESAGMGPRRTRVRLSVGVGGMRKARALVAALPFIVVCGVLLRVPLDLISESLMERPINLWGSLLPTCSSLPGSSWVPTSSERSAWRLRR